MRGVSFRLGCRCYEQLAEVAFIKTQKHRRENCGKLWTQHESYEEAK